MAVKTYAAAELISHIQKLRLWAQEHGFPEPQEIMFGLDERAQRKLALHFSAEMGPLVQDERLGLQILTVCDVRVT